jgi:group I intron endonuclease
MLVYVVTHVPSGKQYVGQKKSKERWNSYWGSGIAIKAAIAKHGLQEFRKEILWEGDDFQKMNELERAYIRQLDTLAPRGYNIAEGGHHGNPYAGKSEEEMKMHAEVLSAIHTGKKVSPETRRRMSIAHLGSSTSEETKRKQSEAHRGKAVSAETRKKLSEALLGRIKSAEAIEKVRQTKAGRIWVTNGVESRQVVPGAVLDEGWRRGRAVTWEVSAETRKKLSEAHLGKAQPPATIEKIRKAQLGRPRAHCSGEAKL